MQKEKPAKKTCAAFVKKTGLPCKNPACPGSDFCYLHRPGAGSDANPAPEPPEQAVTAQKPHEPCSGNSLHERIRYASGDPELMELRTGVAAIKTLLDEHISRLEEARAIDSLGDEEERDCYTRALESHGKRIQSLTSDLFAVIERFGKIEERQHRLLSADEVAVIIAEIKERVISAARDGEEGEPPDVLARRIAAAFESVRLFEPFEE